MRWLAATVMMAFAGVFGLLVFILAVSAWMIRPTRREERGEP